MPTQAKVLGSVTEARNANQNQFLIDEDFNGEVTVRGNGKPCKNKVDEQTGAVIPGQKTVSFESNTGMVFRVPMSMIYKSLMKQTDKVDALFIKADKIKFIPSTKLHLRKVAKEFGITLSNDPITA